MKMSATSYETIVKAMEENRALLCEHMRLTKESGNYKVLEVRIGWDALRAFHGRDFREHLYNVEGLNDKHIETALKKAIKEANISV